jgi:hypothetical protein
LNESRSKKNIAQKLNNDKATFSLAVLAMFATLAFGQAADRPAGATDRQDSNSPAVTRTDDARNDHGN